MLVLRQKTDEGYIIGDEFNANDTVLVDERKINLLKLYGIDVDGVRINADGTVYRAVARPTMCEPIEVAEKKQRLNKAGYFCGEDTLLQDDINNILLSIVAEHDLVDTTIDEVFVRILTRAYPNLMNILQFRHTRKSKRNNKDGYQNETQTIKGLVYKTKDMFYKYPEFAKIVNTGSLLALLGSTKEYFKYTDADCISFVDCNGPSTSLPYLEGVIHIRVAPEDARKIKRFTVGGCYHIEGVVLDVKDLDSDDVIYLSKIAYHYVSLWVTTQQKTEIYNCLYKHALENYKDVSYIHDAYKEAKLYARHETSSFTTTGEYIG